MDCFSSQGLPLESARARLAIAALAADANGELARSEAQGALNAFEELGANADVDGACALLRTLGVPTKRKPAHSGLLTKRETEVLRLLSAGLSNPEIAGRLVISRKTAAHHVSSLLSKLAVRNRAEAVAFAAKAPQT
ncbi:MAG: hypothetical protein GEU75_01680 [Dehalococcoidia bacterium]|nr:hypothetical protein [Dehalococcoidia bacterium]